VLHNKKTKHIPPNTRYNLSNQPLDFKFFLTKSVIFNIFKIIQLDPNFVYPSNKNCLEQEWSIEKHYVHKNCLECKGLRRKFGLVMKSMQLFLLHNILKPMLRRPPKKESKTTMIPEFGRTIRTKITCVTKVKKYKYGNEGESIST
jgi:hypothetical protein